MRISSEKLRMVDQDLNSFEWPISSRVVDIDSLNRQMNSRYIWSIEPDNILTNPF